MLTDYVKDKRQNIIYYLKNLGVDIERIEYEDTMLQAFVHKSYSADFLKNISNNERLEFLGDSVLGCIIAELLFLNYPDMKESDLTLYKIALVKESNLAEVARDIDLGNMVFLGHGEEKNNGRDKDVILADCLEAVIGYIYVDLGMKDCEDFVKNYIYSKINDLKDLNMKSYKSLLQEEIQRLYKSLPVYYDEEYDFDYKNNAISYKSTVYFDKNKLGEGFGKNKKKAQEDAAKNSYEQHLKFKK